MNDLEAAYSLNSGIGPRAEPEDRLMIAPFLRCTIPASTKRVIRVVDLTFSDKICLAVSSFNSWKYCGNEYDMPTLLMSIPGFTSEIVSRIAAMFSAESLE
eukprot:1097717_1